MTEEIIELFRRSVDAVNRRDLDAFLALADEDVECVSRIAAMEGELRGHEGARRWWAAWFGAFPDYRIEVMDAEDLGGVVLAAIRAVGHGAGSALPFEDRIWHGSQWRAGKCVWWQVFDSRAEALEVLEQRT